MNKLNFDDLNKMYGGLFTGLRKRFGITIQATKGGIKTNYGFHGRAKGLKKSCYFRKVFQVDIQMTIYYGCKDDLKYLPTNALLIHEPWFEEGVFVVVQNTYKKTESTKK